MYDPAFDAPTVEYKEGEPLRWKHLTIDQRVAVTNGCGPKGLFFDPPEWIFNASCNMHDFNYFIGNKEEDRKKADRQFYEAMKKDAAAAPWYYRWWYYSMAWTYYQAVRLFGGKFFYYGEKERGMEELLDYIDEHPDGS